MKNPSELTSKLPSSIRVGAHDFEIVVCPLPGNFGMILYPDQRILISDNIASRSMIVDTVIHELMHAIFFVYSIKEGDEEHIVTALSTGWTQVFRDNPWLLGWIGNGTK